MTEFIQQLRSLTAANRRWQSYANVDRVGHARLTGIPAHSAFGRCDSLATIGGEAMT
jgi:hypothetical protein